MATKTDAKVPVKTAPLPRSTQKAGPRVVAPAAKKVTVPPKYETIAKANTSNANLQSDISNLAAQIATLNSNVSGIASATTQAGLTTGSGTAGSPYLPTSATDTGTTATGASTSSSGGLLSGLTSGGLTTWLIVGAVVVGGWFLLRKRQS